MASMRDGVMRRYDINIDEMVPVTVDYVTQMEDWATALAMYRLVTTQLGDLAQRVVRGEMAAVDFTKLFSDIEGRIRAAKK